ncbi:MAG TPA: M23 family metallopeptidase [Pseudogracilibacillus sp.]|nr:M23 family metallopeptidase [Pseudogracilibacillus sp.]
MYVVKRLIACLFCITLLSIKPFTSVGEEAILDQALFLKTEANTQVPWYYIAALYQFEKNIDNDHVFTPEQWYGIHNVWQEEHESVIRLFHGIGRDGTGNQLAQMDDDEDLFHTIAMYLKDIKNEEKYFHKQLWKKYKRDASVMIVKNIATIYKEIGHMQLNEFSFPIPQSHTYSYKDTWGDSRGFGGRRIHEGTDLFAPYGTPVLSTSYGIVELKGWNKFGGWRVGIRDVNNFYHYYAHLNTFDENIEIGRVVKPGDVIGTVGSSGYGPVGTSGKFPPHLHYGMYKDNGINEWALNPYPYLRQWE